MRKTIKPIHIVAIITLVYAIAFCFFVLSGCTKSIPVKMLQPENKGQSNIKKQNLSNNKTF